MPRFLFRTQIGGDAVIDPDGRELESPDTANEAARTPKLPLLGRAAADPGLRNAVLFVAKEPVLEFPLTEALAADRCPLGTWRDAA